VQPSTSFGATFPFPNHISALGDEPVGICVHERAPEPWKVTNGPLSSRRQCIAINDWERPQVWTTDGLGTAALE
jgi:hypothetical protein